MSEIPVYQCHNQACSLGSRSEPGHFTGGIAAEGRVLLTGEPLESLEEGVHFGEGFCPNCSEKGEPSISEYKTHQSVEGDDPYQELHDQIALRVADPKDRLTADGAQAAFLRLIDDKKEATNEQ